MPDETSPDLLTCGMALGAVRAESRSANFICSSDAIDSYGEIVEQSFRLERYLKNPVVLYAHNARELPIGHAKNIGVIDGKLQCTVTFASEKANPQAERVWQSLQEGVLRSVSIGFYPNNVRVEKRDGKDVTVLSDNELFEISVVPIPANADAVMKMRARAFANANALAVHGAAEGGGEKENRMDPEKEVASLKAALDESTRSKDAALSAVEVARAKVAVLETQNAKLLSERDAAIAKTNALEEKAIEQEVEALVGKKFLRDEKATYLRMRKLDKEWFDDSVAKRPDMHILGERIVKSSTETDAAADADDDDLGQAALERARARSKAGV